MSNSIFSVDEEEQKRQAEHKLRPRPIDINQKLEILVHTLEEVAEEKNAIFFSDLTTVQYSDEPEPLKVSLNKYYYFFWSANQIYRFYFGAVIVIQSR
jgi:hypothetical protein